jgi:CheY-like chemotaxis protein
MKINAKPLPFALAFAAQTSARLFRRVTPSHMNWAPQPLPPAARHSALGQTHSGSSTSGTPAAVTIFAVDDMPSLTELYASLLEPAGHQVRTFNERISALVALKADRTKPALLITDYLGLSMPVDQFMHACRVIHPALRILMASGFNPQAMRLRLARPDHFIQKPFTPEQFRDEVQSALAGLL